jgi:hypothetical protein
MRHKTARKIQSESTTLIEQMNDIWDDCIRLAQKGSYSIFTFWKTCHQASDRPTASSRWLVSFLTDAIEGRGSVGRRVPIGANLIYRIGIRKQHHDIHHTLALGTFSWKDLHGFFSVMFESNGLSDRFRPEGSVATCDCHDIDHTYQSHTFLTTVSLRSLHTQDITVNRHHGCSTHIFKTLCHHNNGLSEVADTGQSEAGIILSTLGCRARIVNAITEESSGPATEDNEIRPIPWTRRCPGR